MLRHQMLFSPPQPNRLRVIKRIPRDNTIPVPEISIPGAKNLTQPNGNLRKLMWILAITFCLCIALFQIKERIDHYLNGAISVRVSVALDEKPKFPHITICPPANWSTNDRIRNLSATYVHTFKKPFTCLFDFLRLNGISAEYLWSVTKLDLSGIITLSWNYSINDTLDKSFTPSIRGYCLTYHAKEKFPSFLLPPVMIELTRTGLSINVFALAYTIMIHDNPHLTAYDYASDGFVTRTHALLTMKTAFTKFSYLNTRKAPCTYDTKALMNCRNQCLSRKLSGIVKTKLPYHNLPNLRLCNTTEECVASNAASLNFFSNFNWNQCDCPRLCSGFAYSTYKYTGGMGTAKHSFVRIMIYFDDTIIDKVEEYNAYTEVSLLCDIGSILGLMLGTCILTFIQLIEVLIHYIQPSFKNNVTTFAKPAFKR